MSSTPRRGCGAETAHRRSPGPRLCHATRSARKRIGWKKAPTLRMPRIGAPHDLADIREGRPQRAARPGDRRPLRPRSVAPKEASAACRPGASAMAISLTSGEWRVFERRPDHIGGKLGGPVGHFDEGKLGEDFRRSSRRRARPTIGPTRSGGDHRDLPRRSRHLGDRAARSILRPASATEKPK